MMDDVWHLVPVNDLREHETNGLRCWCKPELEEEKDGTIVVHNALDGREQYETGELKVH